MLRFMLLLLLISWVNSQNTVSDNDLKKISKELLEADTNTANVNYQIQGRLRARPVYDLDVASQPLFSAISSNILNRSTFAKFLTLLDNYDRDSSKAEVVTQEERTEESNFLTAVIGTAVMRKLKQFLVSKGKIQSGDQAFKDYIKSLWFTHYPRASGIVGSSGFEHVFVGELKNNAVTGLHNWLQFYRLERNNSVNYQGYYTHLTLSQPAAFLKFKFAWDTYYKQSSSMFVGTSPEFEMSLYTLCFAFRADTNCPIQLGNKFLKVITHSYKYRGKTYIGSAYPDKA